MILVTAATAPVGRSMVEQLAAAGRPVRALTRDPERAGLPAGAEVVAGDLTDPDGPAAAMAGVEAAFLLAAAPGVVPGFVRAARKAGVRRIVFQSSGAIDDTAGVQPDDVAAFHADVERELRESGLEWTFLRLAVASSDALQWAFDVPGQLAAGDVVRGPYARASVTPMHPADLAAVAIAALTGAEHAGRTYVVTGGTAVTLAEQIRILGEALGRPLVYEELPAAEARAALPPYVPAEVLFADWERHVGERAEVTDAVRRITGRPPRSMREWAEDLARRLAG